LISLEKVRHVQKKTAKEPLSSGAAIGDEHGSELGDFIEVKDAVLRRSTFSHPEKAATAARREL
jgi:DNA-directed RNA polymerase sigma subunit (sigma70/sigma32)